jgi:hypothetical protein
VLTWMSWSRLPSTKGSGMHVYTSYCRCEIASSKALYHWKFSYLF